MLETFIKLIQYELQMQKQKLGQWEIWFYIGVWTGAVFYSIYCVHLTTDKCKFSISYLFKCNNIIERTRFSATTHCTSIFRNLVQFNLLIFQWTLSYSIWIYFVSYICFLQQFKLNKEVFVKINNNPLSKFLRWRNVAMSKDHKLNISILFPFFIMIIVFVCDYCSWYIFYWFLWNSFARKVIHLFEA